MEKLSQAFVSKLSQLQRRFESILENDFEHRVQEVDRNNAPFEASLDQSLIRGLPAGLPDDHVDRAIVAFHRLSLLFDAGLLLENNDNEWRAQAYFHRGHTQLIKAQDKKTVRIPPMTLLTILKTSSQNMLQRIQMEHLDPDDKTTCLLIKVSPDFSYMLFSRTADLWLKEHIENVRKALISGFAD